MFLFLFLSWSRFMSRLRPFVFVGSVSPRTLTDSWFLSIYIAFHNLRTVVWKSTHLFIFRALQLLTTFHSGKWSKPINEENNTYVENFIDFFKQNKKRKHVSWPCAQHKNGGGHNSCLSSELYVGLCHKNLALSCTLNSCLPTDLLSLFYQYHVCIGDC